MTEKELKQIGIALIEKYGMENGLPLLVKIIEADRKTWYPVYYGNQSLTTTDSKWLDNVVYCSDKTNVTLCNNTIPADDGSTHKLRDDVSASASTYANQIMEDAIAEASAK